MAEGEAVRRRLHNQIQELKGGFWRVAFADTDFFLRNTAGDMQGSLCNALCFCLPALALY